MVRKVEKWSGIHIRDHHHRKLIRNIGHTEMHTLSAQSYFSMTKEAKKWRNSPDNAATFPTINSEDAFSYGAMSMMPFRIVSDTFAPA